VVASLRRWAIRDGHGAQMLAEGNRLESLDARRVRLTLARPWSLVLDALAKPSGLPAFIMPARVAATPITTSITDPTGSGPYMLRREDWRLGDRTTYRRNPGYQPRAEPPDGMAGGKHARIETVEWLVLPDSQTALNALQTGELDLFEECPPDLFSVVARNRALRLAAQDAAGVQPIFRMNHAVPPFDNPKLRQAMLLLVDPAEMMPAYMTDPARWQDCRSLFPCASPVHTSAGWVTPNLDLARTAVQRSGYDGTPVVVLDAQDSTISSTFARVSADRMRRAGLNVDLQAMDWATLVTRRLSRNPVQSGGWSLFCSAPAAVNLMDPVSHIALRAAGPRTALPGWPDDARLEALRDAYATAPDHDARQAIAAEVQARALEVVPYVPLGTMSLVRGLQRPPLGVPGGRGPRLLEHRQGVSGRWSMLQHLVFRAASRVQMCPSERDLLYSTCIRSSRTSGRTAATCCATIAPNSAALLPPGSAPSSSTRATSAGCRAAAATSACKRARMGSGVRAGAKKPFQPSSSALAKPCSRTVATSGSTRARLVASVAIGRSVPLRICVSEEESWSPPNWMRPASMSCTSGAAPRKGTWSMGKRPSRFSTSPTRLIVLPGPVEP
jgi:peptide/nickel transport system substrate-binding protein